GSGRRKFPQDQLEAARSASDPMADLMAGRFADPDLLRRLILHERLNGRQRDVLYSMDVTDTEFHAYQFKPVVKLLSSPSQGLLIADEVGLGKTIEAGMIWTEMVARFDAHRLLVVCPKSLTEKWRQELWQKFSVDAKIVDATGLMEALRRDAEGADGLVTGRSSEKRSCDGPCPRAPAPFVFPNVVSERVLIVALSVVRGCSPRLRHKIRVPIPPASLRRTEADYRCQ